MQTAWSMGCGVSLCALILAVCWVDRSHSVGMEQVESRPIDGHQFTEGQTFRFVCKATGNQDFAVRLLCPLSGYAPSSLTAAACFENCGRPLCNQPALNDCAKTMPELLDTGCTRRVSQLSGDTQEITVEYEFRSISVRNGGTYACQYKNMRSSVDLSVAATTTSTTTSTSTTATTTTTTTTAKPTTTTRSTTTTAATTTAAKPLATSAMAVPASTAKSTAAALATARPAPDSRMVTSRPASGANNGDVGDSPAPEKEGRETTTDPTGDVEVQLKSGWFYSSLVGKLVGIDIVLIVLLIVLVIILICGFLLIRCQVRSRRTDGTAAKRPMQSCCSALLCIGDNGVNGGAGAGKPINGHRPAKLHSLSNRRPPIQAFPGGGGGSDTASGQVYSEANLDSSTYSQGEPDRQAAGGAGDAYYHLQTHFIDADPRLMVGGSQRGPHGAGGFFNRDAPDRHSFHNVRASRQRPAIPADLLLTAGGGGAGEPAGTEIREQVDKQRREILQLRQQLRDSQLRLTRLTSSQQELHRSVSFSRMAAAAAAAASAATTPADEPLPAPIADDYELLARATTPGSATTELPSFAAATATTTSGGGGGGDGIGGVLGGLRASADLLLSIDEPIEEEEGPDEPAVEYPTVRSSKRRSSIGEAYGAGRMCPA